jgi:RNA polymerase sigma-70 factor (ECF subfamily)
MTGAVVVATRYDAALPARVRVAPPRGTVIADPGMEEQHREASPDPLQDDRHLVRRMLAGDDQAFGEFCARYLSRLYRFALHRLRGNEDLALEMVQATTCIALAHLGSYRGEAPLVSWLFSICRHEIHRHFRRLPRRPIGVGLLTELDQNSAQQSLRAESPTPEEALQIREREALVHEILDRLPGRYGDALEWKYIEGLSVREIAVRLEVSPKAAESLLTRARVAFRDAVEAARGARAGWSPVEEIER